MCIPLLYPLQLQCSYDYLAEEFGAEISLTFCEEAVQNPMMAQALHLLKDIDGLNVRIFLPIWHTCIYIHIIIVTHVVILLWLFYAFHQRVYLSASFAKLFSEHHLESEEETKKHFLPALKTLATTKRFRRMAMYMLLLLLHKMPENGVSLLTAALPSEVHVHNYTK